MQNAIKYLLRTTWLIDSGFGYGTGFLLRWLTDIGCGHSLRALRFFLITNKHVIRSRQRKSPEKIMAYVSWNEINGNVLRKRVVIPLIDANGNKTWRGHSNNSVDILAFDVTPIITQFSSIENNALNQRNIATQDVIEELDIHVGDNVVILGYPGFQQGNPMETIVYEGTIASEFDKPYTESFNGEKQVLPGFLVNETVVPGMSGSPVYLKPSVGRSIHGRNHLGYHVPPLLLGIIAETRFATTVGSSFAGVGFAFDAYSIIETIKLFSA